MVAGVLAVVLVGSEPVHAQGPTRHALTLTSFDLKTLHPERPATRVSNVASGSGSSGQIEPALPANLQPQKFRQIKILSKSQATAVAIALRAGDTATISGLIPEPYATTLNVGGLAFAPLFDACGTDGLPGGCIFGFESNPLAGQFGFQVLSVGAI